MKSKKSLTFYVHRDWMYLFAKHEYWKAANTIPEFLSSKAHIESLGKKPELYVKVRITIEEI